MPTIFPEAEVNNVPLPRGDLVRPRGLGFGAQVGELNVRLAVHPEYPLRYYTRDSLAGRIADKSSVYENTLDIGYVFSRQDLTGGAGLDWFPRRNTQTEVAAATDEIRFWDSRNIDVSRTRFDSEYVLRLHRRLVVWEDYGGEKAFAIGRTPNSFYVGTDQNIFEYATLSGTPTPVATTPVPSQVVEIENLGFDVYALLEDGDIWRKLSNETLFTVWANPSGQRKYTGMWTVKGRVVAQEQDNNGNDLVEIKPSGGGVAVVIDSFPIDVRVQAVVDAGPVILAAVTNGYIYSYQLNNEDLLEIVSQTELPDGEAPISLAYNQGLVFYATADAIEGGAGSELRGYIGEVLDARFNFVIGNAQLIYETDSNVDLLTGGFSDMLITRDEIWWVLYETGVHDVAEQVSLFRLDVATQGLNRANSFDFDTGTKDPLDLTIFEGRKFFILNGDVYVESDTEYAGSPGDENDAWIIYPNVNFGLNADINWVATVFDVGGLVSSGIQAELYRSQLPEALFLRTDPSWVLQQRITSPGTSGNEFPMVKVTAKQLALQVRLFPHSVKAETPTVRSVAIRGLPKARDWIVELPINISDYIEVPYRQTLHIPGWGDRVHEAIQNLSGSHLELLVVAPFMAFRGVVDMIEEPVVYKSDRGSVGRVAVVRFRGSKITATEVPTGDAGLGLGLLGVAVLGVGQSADT